MKQRGQVAIEFIFIILIVIVYLATVTHPFIQNSKGIMDDITKVAQVNYETQRIVDSMNKINLLGTGSQETLTIVLPSETRINCNDVDSKMGFTAQINTTGNNPPVGLCPNNNCEKEFNLNTNNLTCTKEYISSGVNKIKILKGNNGIEFK